VIVFALTKNRPDLLGISLKIKKSVGRLKENIILFISHNSFNGAGTNIELTFKRMGGSNI
jgi:hypothetical protein